MTDLPLTNNISSLLKIRMSKAKSYEFVLTYIIVGRALGFFMLEGSKHRFRLLVAWIAFSLRTMQDMNLYNM
jgi:hypothetical protein